MTIEIVDIEKSRERNLKVGVTPTFLALSWKEPFMISVFNANEIDPTPNSPCQ